MPKYPADRHRRALRLLDSSPDGVTEAVMLAHGFSIELMADLVHNRLAVASRETVLASGRSIEVTRMKITAAGRRALQ
jgi:hypothetical protein